MFLFLSNFLFLSKPILIFNSDLIQRLATLFFTVIFLIVSCEKKQPKQSYLALGDNYTIGESVSKNERWPIQLIKVLENEKIFIDSPQIIAETKWTTANLKRGIDNNILNFPYDWVSLLIGVNNQSQGKSLKTFKAEFEQLLDQAIMFAGNKREHVFVVSIPDWGVMPFAENLDREQITIEIDNFNQVVYEVSVKNEVSFIDITPISRSIDSNPKFIALDSLHPSSIQYARWVKEIVPFFLNSLND